MKLSVSLLPFIKWRLTSFLAGVLLLGLGLTANACANFASQPLEQSSNQTQSPTNSNSSANEWPMEGQSPERNRATNGTIQLPLSVQTEYNLQGDAEHASPIAITGGLLFAESDRKLHAVTLENGEEQWEFNLAGSFLSPAAVNGTVYVRSETGTDGFVFALAADSGAKLWQYKFAKVGSSYDNIGGHVTSPVVADGMVLVGAAENVVALGAQDGKELWHFVTEYPVVSSVSVADGLVYFADFTRLYALDLQTGQERWRFDHGKLALYFAPIIVGDQIALAGEDTIYLLNRTSGKQTWSKRFDDIQIIPAGASAHHLYVKATNQLWALDLAQGQVAWNFSTTNFISLPALTDDQIYIITRAEGGSQVRALQQASGKEIWRQEQAGLANAAPVIAGGNVYVRAISGKVLVFRSS